MPNIMPVITGYVERIVYRNPQNGYSVLTVSSEGEEYTLVGSFASIDTGEYIEADTSVRNHSVYGEQYQVLQYKIKEPEDMQGIERYLASGAIKGIKEVLASRIVKKFKKDTLRVIEEEPHRLTEVRGISERMAKSIAEQVIAKREMREAMIFLQKYGIGMNLAAKIYQEYGDKIYTILTHNPYQIADDIPGVGFKIADDIAVKAGIQADSVYRIKSGVVYAIEQAALNGHTYLPKEELLLLSSDMLHLDQERIEDILPELQMERRIVIKLGSKDEQSVYIGRYYYTELAIAKMLHDLNASAEYADEELDLAIRDIEKKQDIILDERQRKAVKEAIRCGLLVITGGPGTGKTTTVNTIIRYFQNQRKEVLLAAPTGRAAKRLSESTGSEARTIHRLLEINGMPSEEDEELSGLHFERNAQNPLEGDVIIIDEMSMVDIFLMQSLLDAVSVGTRLVLVGDTNQLPSVGPGNVLKDIIESGSVPVVQLDTIYRQAAQSDIIVNAHAIIHGEQIDLKKPSRDFLFVQREEADAIISAMLTLVSQKLPAYVETKPYEVQVMSPMRKGPLGVERLNKIMQENLNPESISKKEKELGGILFREGDKLMQIKNNYQIAWELKNSRGFVLQNGQGMYNGDIGILREIDLYQEKLRIEFDEGKFVEYAFSETDELEHAFAITIHKSQGSEYPAVVIPLYRGPDVLMTRNLIYTAVTRAKKCVTLVGTQGCFYKMAGNNIEMKRYSGLKERIQELFQ